MLKQWTITIGLIAILVLAGGLGTWAAQATFERASGQVSDLENRLRELGLTESQLQNTIAQGIETFIIDQQMAQARAEQERQDALAARLRPINPQEDFIAGSLNAEFSMIEYSDYECPFCKRFHATARSFVRDNVSVNWAHRHFPLPNHNPMATQAAMGAECVGYLADAAAYWAYTDAYYERTRSSGRGVEGQTVQQLMEEVGVSGADAQACLNDPQILARVQAMTDEGQAAGVSGTPGVFIRHNPTGQVMRIPGAVPLPQLQASFNQFRASVGG